MKTYLSFITLLFLLISAFPQANQNIRHKDNSDIHFRIIGGIGINQFHRNYTSGISIIRDTLNSVFKYIKPGAKFTVGAVVEKDLNKKWAWRIGSILGLRGTIYKELPFGSTRLISGHQWTASINVNTGFNFILHQTDNRKLYLIGGGLFNFLFYDWGNLDPITRPWGAGTGGLYLFVPEELGIYSGLGVRRKRFSFELTGGVSSSLFFRERIRDNNASLDFQVGYFLLE